MGMGSIGYTEFTRMGTGMGMVDRKLERMRIVV